MNKDNHTTYPSDHTLDDSVTEFMRPRKGMRYREVIAGCCDRSGDLHITEYSDVTLSPLGQIAGASEMPSSDLLIDDCDFCARMENGHDKDHTSLRLTGTVLYGGFFRTQWGHFLMNSTSRLWPLYTDLVKDVDHILFFADTPDVYTPEGNYKEFLELAGIIDKVIIVAQSVAVEHLIVPEIAFEHYRYFSREAMYVFNAVKAAVKIDKNGNGADKVFLTRSGLPNAQKDEINIVHLDALFQDNGYKVVSPEKVTLSQLISLMKGAESIGSLSGSTAHNLVFADMASEFVIIERTGVVNAFQIGISLMTGNHPTHIDAYRLPQIAPATGRLFLYGATESLTRFIADRGWINHSFASSEANRRHELRGFMKRYTRQSGYAIGIQEWQLDDAPAIAEAYVESYQYYKPWLDRQLPLFFTDWLSPRCLARVLRNALKRFRK